MGYQNLLLKIQLNLCCYFVCFSLKLQKEEKYQHSVKYNVASS